MASFANDSCQSRSFTGKYWIFLSARTICHEFLNVRIWLHFQKKIQLVRERFVQMIHSLINEFCDVQSKLLSTIFKYSDITKSFSTQARSQAKNFRTLWHPEKFSNTWTRSRMILVKVVRSQTNLGFFRQHKLSATNFQMFVFRYIFKKNSTRSRTIRSNWFTR